MQDTKVKYKENWENLQIAIVGQAVSDYALNVARIANLIQEEKARNKILNDWKKENLRQIKKGKAELKEFTLQEAEAERKLLLRIELCEIEKIEKWFTTDWCKLLSGADSDFMIKRTREEAIDRMIQKIIFELKPVTVRNQKSKSSQRKLERFETVKNFLYSEWLARFTERGAAELVQQIIVESECEVLAPTKII